jgi:hypothetical protein
MSFWIGIIALLWLVGSGLYAAWKTGYCMATETVAEMLTDNDKDYVYCTECFEDFLKEVKDKLDKEK